ncbi:uncharacterized protein LOC135226756 [Macrobrachium nipponense]|uniref:uncharacterized protein LOC135226756 n=1 Tax=Macrobrachium nipponense TaxID=159736 RepID=UPI0030C887B7
MCSKGDPVAQLLASFEKRGINPALLAKLPAYQQIVQKRATLLQQREFVKLVKSEDADSDEIEVLDKGFVSSRCVLYSLIIGVVAVILGLILQYELHTQHGFTRVWLRWENIDLHVEQCTIDMPPAVQDLFRPPVDCGMCRDVTHVEKIHSVSPAFFEERYAYSGRPVVVTDGQQNWSARNTFSFAFFKSIYSEDSPVLENFERTCQFFPYQTEFRNLRQVFNMSEARANMHGDPWYIGWSNCDSSAANILRRHYERPYFLPQSAESSKTDWIFMGSPGYGAHLHVDHVGNPSWQAQIKGRKLWTLVPPPECYYQCVPLEVQVNPGEIIVLDTNIWYHKTLIVSEDLSVTIGSEYD